MTSYDIPHFVRLVSHDGRRCTALFAVWPESSTFMDWNQFYNPMHKRMSFALNINEMWTEGDGSLFVRWMRPVRCQMSTTLPPHPFWPHFSRLFYGTPAPWATGRLIEV